MNDVITILAQRFDAEPLPARRPDLLHARVAADRAIPALAWLRHETGFVQLTHMTAVDWIEDGRFQLTYLLTDPTGRRSLMLDTFLDRDDPRGETAVHLWPQAETYEQEMHEMFGIPFADSPRQGVPFILEGWNDMPPMRRDFDTVAYCETHHPDRPGREHLDPRTYVGRRVGERGYLGD